MKCADLRTLLSAYANDELPRTQKEFIEEHLVNCIDCRATLADYRTTREQLVSAANINLPSNTGGTEKILLRIKKIQPTNNKNSGRTNNTPFWLRLVPKTRLAWILLPLIIFLLGGAVYAGITIVKGLFEQYAPQIEQAGLAEQLDINQTIEGVTVKLERAYADSNVILVGYAVSGPEDKYFALPAELSMHEGTILQGMMGVGVVPGSDMILGSWKSTERTAVIMTFDASAIEGTPENLKLQLKIKVDKNQDTINIEQEETVGPFIFNFTIPFHGGKKITLNQTTESYGIPVLLKEVVISQWATRVNFQVPEINNVRINQEYYAHVTTNDVSIVFPQTTNLEDNAAGKPENITIKFDAVPIGSLTLPNGNTYNLSYSKVSSPDDGITTEYFEGDFTGQAGIWTFEISEMVSPLMNIQITETQSGYYKGHGEQKRISGTWIFQFEVP